MRKISTTLLIGVFAVGTVLSASPLSARDIDMSHMGADELEQKCNAAGGQYIEASDESIYGCKKDCNGGTCAVICDTEECFGVVPDRRMVLTKPPMAADVLAGRVKINEELTAPGRDRLAPTEAGGSMNWGLLGLFGLVGLAGAIIGRKR